MDERRHFTRIPFTADVRMIHHGQPWSTALVDISLHGVLVARPAEWKGQAGDDALIELPLDADTAITVATKVAHIDPNHIGLLFEQMELESASHLKRLLLFNLGDQSLVDREIHELIAIHSKAR